MRVLVDLAGWTAGFRVGAFIGLIGVLAAVLGALRDRAPDLDVLPATAE
ncbi:MAG: hypothetical protein M0Z34_07085 [Nitrospiraceae bacterium]|nr:hypothetical protein [Nitrospiraceae bacterium]